ncbi:MAG: SAM-dependent DNA methyltransferase [Chthonomonas sp.]|nr:SAM-dependent DNA methyltransferase [Chthonomonas sp.]
MNAQTLGWITNFIWGIADDVLRDVYVRGKYRDVILPMVVIRRLDAVLEPTKQDVLDMKATLDQANIADQYTALRSKSGQAFYNASPFTLRDLQSRAKSQQLRADFEAYLDGFSPNVQEILEKFKFRNQIPTMVDADILGSLIEKFLDRSINLSPNPVMNVDGTERIAALDNHAMGTMFEELIRKFNEENNEEAGEHFTPRDVVKLMADLIFWPVANKIESSTYLVYDAACGTGGMLTVAEERLREIGSAQGKDVSIHLYGQEVNPETYAITKADLLLKGEGDEAENFRLGSTLSQDGFPTREFDFMLSNPPYGKSWKTDLERMGGKADLSDSRFIIDHAGDPEFSLITRSSDGQLMFLVNKLAKMKHNTPLGSRIVEVHNGSALFTGDAGQGESNIRRWILENDWLEAIIALPLNMFYNTGIATYLWVLTNRKPEHRQGKVQLIDATQWFKSLRKNLGKKNCELAPEDIQKVMDSFLAFEENEQSKLFPNEAFGYWKVVVERPLRLHSQFTRKAIECLRFATGDETLRRELYAEFGQRLPSEFASIRAALELRLKVDEPESDSDSDEEETPKKKQAVSEKRRKKLLDAETWKRDQRLHETAKQLSGAIGETLFEDHNEFRRRVDKTLKTLGIKLSQTEKKIILKAVSWREETAARVISKIHKPGTVEADPMHGLFEQVIDGKTCVVEFEPDTDLRDTENVPLLEEGGIEAFINREVLPHVPDAWVDHTKTQIGYEISFTRYFYKPKPMRTLEEIRRDIEALEQETEGLLDEVLVEVET